MAENPAPQSPTTPFKTVAIHDIGKQKISFIKLLRQWTALGLKEAKDVSELPKPFALVVADEPRAEEFRRAAEAIGAKCELRDMLDTDQPVIPDDARFGFEPAGKSGCATTACLLLMVGGGLTYGLSLLV